MGRGSGRDVLPLPPQTSVFAILTVEVAEEVP